MDTRTSLGLALVLAGCSTDAATASDAQSDGATPLDSGTFDVRADALHVTESVVVTIDVSSNAGNMRDLVGDNKAPRASEAKSGGNSYDLAAAYKAIGISQVRLHDNVDLCTIYKDAKIEDYASGSPITVPS